MTDQPTEVVASESSVAESCLYPTTSIQLPSRGFFYEGALPGGIIELRPMTTQEEKILLSPRADRFSLLDTVLERCMVNSKIALRDLLIGDKFFLLLSLRSITYGTAYTFSSRCRRCNCSSPINLTLPEGLSIRIFTEDDKEPFAVTLPISGKTLELHLLRVRDEEEVQRWSQQAAARGRGLDEGDPAYTYRLARHIATVDGEKISILDALALCERMIGGDSLAMRESIDDHDCGATLMLNQVCARCGSTYEEVMPLTSDFFRPGSKSGRGR